jgi:hypothetical protein
MSGNRLDPALLNRLANHPKVKGKVSKDAIRPRLSEIRRDNPGITLNAAAHLFAKSKGFSLFRHLDELDKLSLRDSRSRAPPITPSSNSRRRIHRHATKASFATEFIADADRNADAYPYVYLLENSLRALILEQFQSKQGWWSNIQYVDGDTQRKAAWIQQAEKKHAWLPARANHPIYYVGLEELYGIIEKNWRMFKGVFKDMNILRTWINESVPIRNLIAHNIPVQRQERTNIEIKAKYICTMIDRKRKTQFQIKKTGHGP